MYIFRHRKDLNQLPPGSQARLLLGEVFERLIQAYAPYNPEEHGYVALVEANDVHRQRILPELPCPLADVPWEGVTLVDGFFHTIVLTNNDFGISFVIPDEPWLSETVRTSLEEHLSQF